MKLELQKEDVSPIFEEIKTLVNEARVKVYTTVNIEMLNLHWNIGKIIMEIQEGNNRAKYGEQVLIKLSELLTKEFGRGFSSKNLRRMRQFYSCFPIWTSVMSKLSWTHYLELIKIDNEYK